jgi:hypothetical protein
VSLLHGHRQHRCHRGWCALDTYHACAFHNARHTSYAQFLGAWALGGRGGSSISSLSAATAFGGRSPRVSIVV